MNRRFFLKGALAVIGLASAPLSFLTKKSFIIDIQNQKIKHKINNNIIKENNVTPYFLI